MSMRYRRNLFIGSPDKDLQASADLEEKGWDVVCNVPQEVEMGERQNFPIHVIPATAEEQTRPGGKSEEIKKESEEQMMIRRFDETLEESEKMNWPTDQGLSNEVRAEQEMEESSNGSSMSESMKLLLEEFSQEKHDEIMTTMPFKVPAGLDQVSLERLSAEKAEEAVGILIIAEDDTKETPRFAKVILEREAMEYVVKDEAFVDNDDDVEEEERCHYRARVCRCNQLFLSARAIIQVFCSFL